MSVKVPEILIVDDTPSNIRLLSEILSDEGYQVRQAISGSIALESAQIKPPDVILLDIQMPVMDGYEVCKKLKALPQTADIPVIFISAFNSIEDRLEAFDSGGVDYISKPFYAQEVLVRVKNQLTIALQKQQLKAQNLQLQQEIEHRKQAEIALKNLNQELKRLSSLDGLTQLANRRCFNEYLEQEWEKAHRTQTFISLIMADVDCFKNYNDFYGHLAGDRCLQAVAKTLAQTIRCPADLVARYGGEEFAVLLPDTSLENATTIAQLIHRRVQNLKIQHHDSAVSSYITLSLGVFGLVPEPAQSPDVLIAGADRGLYLAKQQGRDRLICNGIAV